MAVLESVSVDRVRLCAGSVINLEDLPLHLAIVVLKWVIVSGSTTTPGDVFTSNMNDVEPNSALGKQQFASLEH